tara:strand:- start:1753 stop:2175 length:423 start_codon:yes stop_codon:yes gene_type:complete
MNPDTKEHLDKLYSSLSNTIHLIYEEKNKIEKEHLELKKKYKKLETEFTRYKSVSIVKKQDRELFEKNNEIIFLKKKLENFKKNKTKSTEESTEVDIILIDDKEYYITQDIHNDVYEKLDDSSVGNIIGKYINKRLVYTN